MAKSNSTKAKAEPAAEDQVNATAATTEGGQEPAPAAEGKQEGQEPTPAATTTEEDLEATYVVDSMHGLNLRKAPRFGAKVLGILPDGTEISVALGMDGPEGWLPVLVSDEVVGWVCARYVKKIEE